MKVLEDVVNEMRQGNVSDDEQVVELIHDEFLHAFHGILELGVGGVSPHVTFSHLCCDELNKLRLSRIKGYCKFVHSRNR